jgi:formylmethanofuran dehydrogenase subunit E
MVNFDTLFLHTAAFRDYLCPRQVLGVRMNLYAAELLELNLPQSDKRFFTFVETDGCFVDEVSVTTGCWLDRRTMRLLGHGEITATFVDTDTECALRILLHALPQAHATL